MLISTAVLILCFAGLVIGGLLDSGLPRAYRERRCQGARWRRSFPQASKQAIRDFLKLFTSAFAINSEHRLRFCPSDELIAIYRARYPSQLTPDALEFETLDRDLQRQFGLKLAPIWHDGLTLGELFAMVIAAQPVIPADALRRR